MINTAKLFLPVILILSLCVSAIAKEPEWLLKLREIELFKSTKADVERIYENPKITEIYNYAEKEELGWSIRFNYELEEGELEASYSTGRCSETKNPISYDADKDIVVRLSFYPKIPFPKQDLQFDLNEFKSEPILDLENSFMFRNKKLGIEIFVADGNVETIEFFPTSENKKLKCQNKE